MDNIIKKMKTKNKEIYSKTNDEIRIKLLSMVFYNINFTGE